MIVVVSLPIAPAAPQLVLPAGQPHSTKKNMKKKPSGLPSEAGQKEEQGQSTPQAWAKNESEGGFSSDSSVELAPSLKVDKPAQPRQSIPGFRRNRSWQEPEPRPEVQRVLNSLTSFRSAMVASQKQMLQLLDDELERLKTGPSLSQGLRAAVRKKISMHVYQEVASSSSGEYSRHLCPGAAAAVVPSGRKSQTSTTSEAWLLLFWFPLRCSVSLRGTGYLELLND